MFQMVLQIVSGIVPGVVSDTCFRFPCGRVVSWMFQIRFHVCCKYFPDVPHTFQIRRRTHVSDGVSYFVSDGVSGVVSDHVSDLRRSRDSKMAPKGPPEPEILRDPKMVPKRPPELLKWSPRSRFGSRWAPKSSKMAPKDLHGRAFGPN